jgi:hypothetical protein
VLDVLLDAATEVAGLLENDHRLKVLISSNIVEQYTDFIEQMLQDPNFALDVLPDAVTNLAGNHGIECYTYEAIIASQVVVKRKGCRNPLPLLRFTRSSTIGNRLLSCKPFKTDAIYLWERRDTYLQAPTVQVILLPVPLQFPIHKEIKESADGRGDL